MLGDVFRFQLWKKPFMDDKVIRMVFLSCPVSRIIISSVLPQLLGYFRLDESGEIDHGTLGVIADDPYFQCAHAHPRTAA